MSHNIQIKDGYMLKLPQKCVYIITKRFVGKHTALVLSLHKNLFS